MVEPSVVVMGCHILANWNRTYFFAFLNLPLSFWLLYSFCDVIICRFNWKNFLMIDLLKFWFFILYFIKEIIICIIFVYFTSYFFKILLKKIIFIIFFKFLIKGFKKFWKQSFQFKHKYIIFILYVYESDLFYVIKENLFVICLNQTKLFLLSLQIKINKKSDI